MKEKRVPFYETPCSFAKAKSRYPAKFERERRTHFYISYIVTYN